MSDERLGGRCRESGCFKPAGHPDDHGVGQSEVEAHLQAMGPKDKLLPYSCPICAEAHKRHNDGGVSP